MIQHGNTDTDTASVDELRSQAVQLAHELPGTPQHIRVEAAGNSVEVEWDTSGEAAAAPPSGEPDAETPPSGHRVAAPLVGTFYRAASPGEPPFVEVGDVVAAGQQVAIVEAMKLMNAVETSRSGTVTAVLVEDGEMVEFGQPLVELDGS